MTWAVVPGRPWSSKVGSDPAGVWNSAVEVCTRGCIDLDPHARVVRLQAYSSNTTC
jgi:hypothetical protein